MDDVEARKFLELEVRATEGRRDHIPVTYWMADGVRHQGHTPRLCGTTIFVESKQVVPVGTELTITLTESPHDVIGWGAVEGTIVWHCPLCDDFKNHPGFAVSLRSNWLQLGSTEPQELNGIA